MSEVQFSQEELQELAQRQEVQEAVMGKAQGKQQPTPESVEDSIALKMQILQQESSEDMDKLMSRDVLLANLTDKDKQLVLRYLDIALRFLEIQLHKSSRHFYKKALLVSGVSRGYQGFQQDKLNESREIRESNFEGLRPTGGGSWNPFSKRK